MQIQKLTTCTIQKMVEMNECIDDQPDTADYILTPRPKITADDPEPFVPKDPVTP